MVGFTVLQDLFKASGRLSGSLFGSLSLVMVELLSSMSGIIYSLLSFLCRSELARGLGTIPCIGGGISSSFGSSLGPIMLLFCGGITNGHLLICDCLI